ncbi:unnamed protein product [Closterium sp. NIES-53]
MPVYRSATSTLGKLVAFQRTPPVLCPSCGPSGAPAMPLCISALPCIGSCTWLSVGLQRVSGRSFFGGIPGMPVCGVAASWFFQRSRISSVQRASSGVSPGRFWQRRWNRNSVGHVYFDIHLERFQVGALLVDMSKFPNPCSVRVERVRLEPNRGFCP